MVFKIVFPTGYQIKNVLNDNLDVNIVVSNRKVFFGTLFTLDNIHALMTKEKNNFFWATDMLIVKDLRKDSIRKAIAEVFENGYIEQIFTKIGSIDNIFGDNISFNEIRDMSCD